MAQRDGSADIERIRRRLRKRMEALPAELGAAALESIRDGSPITGALGQPVVTGELRRSWKLKRLSATAVHVFSSLFYAPFIEEGFRRRHRRAGLITWSTNRKDLAHRSTQGGFHSVKLTRAGIQRLVDHVVSKLEKQS